MNRVFTVSTFHGSELCARTADGIIVSGQPAAPGVSQVYAYLSRDDSNIAFLFADLPEGVFPRLEPMQAVGLFLPVGVTRDVSKTVFSFYSPRTSRYLLAMPPDQMGLPQPVLLVASDRKAFEQLSLKKCDDYEIPSSLREAQALLDPFGKPQPDAQSLFNFLMQAPLDPVVRHVLNAAGASLPQNQMQEFAAKLATSRPAADRLRQHFPGDLIATHGLLELLDWLNTRKSEITDNSVDVDWRPVTGKAANKLAIGHEFDHLDRSGAHGAFVSLAFLSAMHIRRTVRPRRKACIVATARNEGLYLLDWLAYHRALGFEKFFLYSNDNLDGSDSLLEALSDAGEVTWINSSIREGVRPQWKAYNHALQILPEILDYEWSLFIDIDEYFNLNHEVFADLHDYLAWCGRNPVDAIAFNWVMIGSNGQATWSDQSVRKRFAVTNKKADQHIKSMFRPQKFQASYSHHPIALIGDEIAFRSPSMRVHEFDASRGLALSTKPEGEVAWVNHYYTKSYEEFLLKAARGRGAGLERTRISFPGLEPSVLKWVRTNAVQTASATAPDPLEEKVDAHLGHLLSVPGVRNAFNNIKSRFVQRVSDALDAAEAHPLFTAPDSDGRHILDMLIHQRSSRLRLDSVG